LRTLMLAALLGGGLVGLAAADPMSQSELSYRAGGDYFSFDASHGDCSISCATDARCRAYTLVLANHMCYKKDTVTPAAANNCCRSGVKLMGAMEFSTDRPGSDIRSGFDSPDSPSCETACRDEPTCQAYTWVRAGIQGPTAKCWLKNTEPATVSNTCCVSGVRLPPPQWRVPGELVNPNPPARQ
jgi:PAN domain